MAEPCDDPERLAALRRYDILDTPREADFDQIVELAARVCGTPIAVINLVEDRRQWFKAEVGLGVRETALDVSICRHVLARPGVTVIPDLAQDPRTAGNPLVSVAEGGLSFYAGCLLATREGHAIGTLCVLDRRVRGLDETGRLALATLAGQVMAQLELRLALRHKQALLEAQELLLKEIHHRVRNSLQLIGSVVGLQLRGLADPTARTALQDTGRRIRSVAAVHERLYRAERLDAVDLGPFLEALVEDLRAAAPPGVALELRTVDVAVSQDLAVALALLANELVTNALKYAYPEAAGGRVEIRLERAGAGLLALSVRDWGRGLPPGLATEGGRSLGMRLVHALAGQLGGRLSIGNADPGSLSRLEFAVRPATGDGAAQAGLAQFAP